MENVYEQLYKDKPKFNYTERPNLSPFQEIDLFVDYFTVNCPCKYYFLKIRNHERNSFIVG